MKTILYYKKQIGIMILLSCFTTLSLARSNESIGIKETEGTYEISVPVSSLVLFLPKGKLKRSIPKQQKGKIIHPRYFHFSDETTEVILSGWFENSKSYQGVKKPKPASIKGQPLTYENINFLKIGEWDSISYDIVVESTRIPNLKAHYVHGNTWIELHISGSTQNALRDIVKSTYVKVKKFSNPNTSPTKKPAKNTQGKALDNKTSKSPASTSN